MKQKSPEGYRKLLVFQKAEDIQRLTLEISRLIPRNTRALRELSDQMPPSARSLVKNIAEGWKRRTTDEYLQFIGYAEASNAELTEDARDICVGLYTELRGIKGIMGARGGKGDNGTDRSAGIMGERGLMGFKGTDRNGGERGEKGVKREMKRNGQDDYWYTEDKLTKLKFYPLDSSLPPAVQLYLKCKEVDYLLHKLKMSLDNKMDVERTRSREEMIRRRARQNKEANRDIDRFIENSGLVRLIDGSFVSRGEYESRVAAGEELKLFGE